MQTLRALVIGYGNMGKNWGNVVSGKTGVEIVGVVEIVPANIAQAKQDHRLPDNCAGYDLRTVIKACRPDFVIDCSVPATHYSNAKTALENGCHILGEKPISLDIEQAKEIVQIAQDKQCIYMVNQNYRWRPILSVLRHFIQNGPLGKMLSVNTVYAQNFIFNDTFRHHIKHPLLLDMAVHHFDVVRSLTGANFETVYCIESNPDDSSFKSGSSASAIFTLDNGVVFTYQGSWSDVGQSTSFMGIWRIVCEKGTIVWDGSANPQIEFTANDKLVVRELRLSDSFVPKSENTFLHELETSLDHFIDALRNNTVPETWCGDNIHTLDMVLSAIESSKNRGVVKNQHGRKSE